MCSARISSRAWTWCRAAVPETFRVAQDVSAMMSAGCIYVSVLLQLRTLLWASTIGLLH